MILLACDTSSRVATCALLDDERLLAERSEAGGSHSAAFLPMVERLLAEAGYSYAAVELYTCARGPGSFTGLRVGIATIQALAFATGRPAAGVTTLEALAWPHAARGEVLVCPVIDARNQRVYAQAFCSGQPVLDAVAGDADDFIDALTALPDTRPVLFCGDAAAWVAERARPKLGEARVLPPDERPLSAVAVGQATRALYMRNPDPDRYPPHTLQPVYLGLSQAERTRGIDTAAWKPVVLEP